MSISQFHHFKVAMHTLTSNSQALPTWFIPHGAGPCFFMDWNPPNTWDAMAQYLRQLPNGLSRMPKAIVMVSAHWLEPVIRITSHPRPNLIYDYSGFPKHTYDLQYPAPGDPTLARKIVDLLAQQGIAAEEDPQRGFDHGMFIPMMLMFPKADIPAVQLSLNSNLDPQTHLEIGKALASLRDEGILMIGSGMSFHNMRGYGKPSFTPISLEFDKWLTQTIESDPDIRNKELINWGTAPFANQCHPPHEEEHLLPLMVVAGAAMHDHGAKVFTDCVLETWISGFTFGGGGD